MILVSLGIMALVLLCILTKKDLKPADYAEQKVEAWIENCKEKERIEIESFPENADYVWIDNDGKLLRSSQDAENNKGYNNDILTNQFTY